MSVGERIINDLIANETELKFWDIKRKNKIYKNAKIIEYNKTLKSIKIHWIRFDKIWDEYIKLNRIKIRLIPSNYNTYFNKKFMPKKSINNSNNNNNNNDSNNIQNNLDMTLQISDNNLKPFMKQSYTNTETIDTPHTSDDEKDDIVTQLKDFKTTNTNRTNGIKIYINIFVYCETLLMYI